MARASAAAAVRQPRVAPKRPGTRVSRPPAAVPAPGGRGRASRAAATKVAASPKQRSTGARGSSGRASAARQASARRRASGYAHGGAATVALPLPVRVLNAPFTRGLRVRGERALDTLLFGRGWIVLVGVLLAGIVFCNVDLLKLNRDIAGTADQIEQLKRENGRYRERVARAASSERVQEAAAMQGLMLPQPGDVRYLTAHPGADPLLAVSRYTEPSAAFTAPVPSTPVVPTAPATTPAAATPASPGPAATGAVGTTGATGTTGTTGTTTGTTTPAGTGTTGTTGTTTSTTTPGTTSTGAGTPTTPPAGTATGTAVAPTG